MRTFTLLFLALLLTLMGWESLAEDFKPIRLKSTITHVQPMTGIVLWSTNPAVSSAPIQLEFAYLKYSDVVGAKGEYDWNSVEKRLNEISARHHQAVLRWHDTYVGKPTGVPRFIKELPDYQERSGLSEKKKTDFPDWSNETWRAFVLEFFTAFAHKYDQDPRIAFVQVGFGLWSEYHIYDGPMKLGETFPDKRFQREFALHLATQFKETPWMISVDAAGDHTPFTEDAQLAKLRFGLFDDSFNHKLHKKENEPNWHDLGIDRWKLSPAGGEFSFFKKRDQVEALGPTGPYGIPFHEQAARFHVSFIIGDDQPKYQKPEVVRRAGMQCGYQFKVTRFGVSSEATVIDIENIGIAPIYYDAFPAIDGTRSPTTLKGLLPGQTRECRIAKRNHSPKLTIECDRLVAGQVIEYSADLP